MFDSIEVAWVQWLIQNIIYPYPDTTLVVVGSVTFVLLCLVLRRLFYWTTFSRNKRKLAKHLQQFLSK